MSSINIGSGVYPAEEYFGVDKDSLYSPKDLEHLRSRRAAEKQKARERRRRVSDELSTLRTYTGWRHQHWIS